MKSDSSIAPTAAGAEHATIEARIRADVAELASAISSLFASLPDPAKRAPDLVRLLKIDNPLACRVLRVAHASTPAEAVEFLPTVNQVKRVIDRAAALAPGAPALRAKNAAARFESLVDELGVDQRGFESLVSGLSPKGVRRVDMQHRRAAFRANSHMWGVSTECMAQMMVLLPDASGEKLDLHAINGFVGARITRPNARVLFSAHMRPDNLRHDEMSAAAPPGVPAATLLSEFSSVEGPALRDVSFPRGFRGTSVEFKGVRPSDTETIFVKRSVRAIASIDTREHASSNSLITWPAAMLHKDLIIPAGLTDPDTVSLTAYARREDPKSVYDLDAEDLVPLHDTPEAILSVTAPPPTPDVPRLPELFASVLGASGSTVAGMRFDVYRCRVEFPMMHALVSLRVQHVPRRP